MINQYFNLSNISTSLPDFIINLLLTAILSYLLSLLYVRFGNSLSNRISFSENFIMIGITTMIIITLVKSSIALSLGLVGALSIVRFRTAIKEPEELAYLFFVIAIGLGLGAEQRIVVILGFILISLLIVLKRPEKILQTKQNTYITLHYEPIINEPRLDLNTIMNILGKYCSKVELKRYEDSSVVNEMMLLVELNKLNDINRVSSELREVYDKLNINYLESGT